MSQKSEQKMAFKVKKKRHQSDDFNVNYWQMWGISLFSRGREGVLKTMEEWLTLGEKRKWIATVNPEFMMQMEKDKEFLEILRKTDLNVVDGIGLIWAKKVMLQNGLDERILTGFRTAMDIIKGKHRKEVASGSDLIEDLCCLAADKKYKVFFLGGWGDRAKKTKKYFNDKFLISKNNAMACSGEPEVENKEVIEKINKFKPDVLFVAYGMKKQEEWINRNLKKLEVGLVMGVGRSFDYYSGDLKRAPKIWRKMGFEWLYSLLQEPKRWRRQLVLPKFAWKVLVS